jgi:four helix bundle protein
VHPGRGLKAWEAANMLAEDVRNALKVVPRREFRLADQLTRSADAIAAIISEGCGRRTVPDQLRYYRMAQSETNETQTHLRRARGRLLDLGTFYRLSNRATVTYRLIGALMKSLED